MRKLRQDQRRWLVVLLSFLMLLLTLLPLPSSAQTEKTNSRQKAAVVFDGNILFKVGAYGNFPASERAEIVNEALKEEVRSGKPVKIEVIQDNRQTVIRNRATDRHLLTVTKTDIIDATSTVAQAWVWQSRLQGALRRGQAERSPSYLQQAWLFSLVVVVVAIALHLGLQFLKQWGTRQLVRWLGNPASPWQPWEQFAKVLWQVALVGLEVGLWVSVFFYLTDVFPHARGWRYEFFNLLGSRIFTLGKSSYSALELLLLLGLTIGLWFAVRALAMLFKSYVLGRTGAEQGLQEVIAILTQYILTFLGLIVLWQLWGLDVAALAIVASVLGVGIGFGLQNIANNFISGLIITLERPIQVGDLVKVGELIGTVQRIGARSTSIRTPDQVSIIVPNSRFLENEVINWNYEDPISRLHLPVGVAYGSDVRKVKAALLSAARSHPDVLNAPRPQVWFKEFGESSLNFELLAWIGDPKEQLRLKSELNYRIEESLRRYQIEIPFPQRDLHLRSPQLERLIEALLLKQGMAQSEAKEIPLPAAAEIEPDEFLTPTQLKDSATPESEPQSGELHLLEEPLTDAEIEAVVAAMRGAEGLDIGDRRYRFNLYPACFVGSEAVDWLVKYRNCSRSEAVEIGQILIERGIIHHVVDEHFFKDGYFFYRFCADEI